MRFLLSHKTVIIILACFVLFSGCATPTKNVLPPSDFMAQKGTIGIITITTNESHKGTADYYNLGTQGILDYAIIRNGDMVKQLINCLNKEEIAPIVKKYYLNLFRDGFSREGFKVKTVNTAYDHKNLAKLEKSKLMTGRPGDEMMYFSTIYDLKSISDELQADYLMVLEIHRFGVKRNYYGIMPKTPPSAWTALKCTLIETASNKIIAEHFSEKAILIEEWEEPPDFPKLMKATLTSFKGTIDDVFTGFFGQAP